MTLTTGTEIDYTPEWKTLVDPPFEIPGGRKVYTDAYLKATYVLSFGSEIIVVCYGEWEYDTAMIARQFDANHEPVGDWITLRYCDGDYSETGGGFGGGGGWGFWDSGGFHMHKASGCGVITQFEWPYDSPNGGSTSRIFTLKPSSTGVEVVDSYTWFTGVDYQIANNFIHINENSDDFILMSSSHWYTDESDMTGVDAWKFDGFSISSTGQITYNGIAFTVDFGTYFGYGNLISSHSQPDGESIHLIIEADYPYYYGHQFARVELTKNSGSVIKWFDATDGYSSLFGGGNFAWYQVNRMQAWNSDGTSILTGVGSGTYEWKPDHSQWMPGKVPTTYAAKNPTEGMDGSDTNWKSTHTVEDYSIYNWAGSRYEEYGWPPESPSPYFPATFTNGGSQSAWLYGQITLGGKHISYAYHHMLPQNWTANGVDNYLRWPWYFRHQVTLDTFGSSPKWALFNAGGSYSSWEASRVLVSVAAVRGTPYIYAQDEDLPGGDPYPAPYQAGRLMVAALPWESEPPPLKLSQRDDDKVAGAQRIAYRSENSGDIRAGRVAW